MKIDWLAWLLVIVSVAGIVNLSVHLLKPGRQDQPAVRRLVLGLKWVAFAMLLSHGIQDVSTVETQAPSALWFGGFLLLLLAEGVGAVGAWYHRRRNPRV